MQRWSEGLGNIEEIVIRDWRQRYENQRVVAWAKRPHRQIQAADQPDLTEKSLKKYVGLRKHESSLLVQMRTGKIGLRAFLFARRVPGVSTPRCRCGNGAIETASHIVLDCELLERERQALSRRVTVPLRTHRDFMESLTDPKTATTVVRWFLSLGWLQEYRLAIRIATQVATAARQSREADGGGGQRRS